VSQRSKVGLIGLVFGLLGFAIVFAAGFARHRIPFYAWYRDPLDLAFFIVMLACFVICAFCLIGWCVWDAD
jgi:hypothetical protein